MGVHFRAGKKGALLNPLGKAKLTRGYYFPLEGARVSFGTSGHRGSSLKNTFNEPHILATTQAICEFRAREGRKGPVFLGKDTHLLSEEAFRTSLSVLAANNVDTVVQEDMAYSPTPVISHAILTHNRGKTKKAQADGVILTPSHNPPIDGGIKYNPTHGGPADTDVTSWIQDRANQILEDGNKTVKFMPFSQALRARTTTFRDIGAPYIKDLAKVIDMKAISNEKIRIGVDVLGSAAVGIWERIAERFKLDITLENNMVDHDFSFMTIDKDGKVRMDCSSPWAMASLIAMKDRFEIAWGNDTDVDRHGIVTPEGLMNPNHYLSAAIWYLLQYRPKWKKGLKIGKTLVSSSMIDRVSSHLGRKVYEVPVGFKWFVEGLHNGWLAFGGEESAGASFLRMDGKVSTTEKDGITMGLLAAEMMARTGFTPSVIYGDLRGRFGDPAYERIDTPANEEQRKAFKTLTPDKITRDTLAGEKITGILTEAPGNHAPIGGLKVVTPNAWFAARPSGTEPIAKLYAESFNGPDHLKQVQKEAQEILEGALK